MDLVTRAAAAEILRMRARHMLKGADVHVDAERGMRRKRNQPRGSKRCACGQTISANKWQCRACA